MNYISEINGFYHWVMLNPLPPDAQALWHILMQMNNRCAVKLDGSWFWRVEFAVPNTTLLSILTFSRQQLDRMRNVLIQAGRIVYKKGKGNQSGIYKIIPFDNSLTEYYVDNVVENVWVATDTTFVSHNVTQFDTQLDTQFDTQSGHKLIHKADTNENLCNIMGTLINSNNNYNNIYNNTSLCGGDDIIQPRAREEADSDELWGLNAYVAMTPELKKQIVHIVRTLFGKYFTRQPSNYDAVKVADYIYCVKNDIACIDAQKKELLEYAFRAASMAGKDNWAYVEGVLRNTHSRGLHTCEACEDYDFERDLAK